jgi:hypothetical protein
MKHRYHPGNHIRSAERPRPNAGVIGSRFLQRMVVSLLCWLSFPPAIRRQPTRNVPVSMTRSEIIVSGASPIGPRPLPWIP